METPARPPGRLRTSRTALVPVIVLAICTVPVIAAAPWTVVLLAVPLLLAAWVLRAGVDVDAEGLTVRAVLGQRRVPWPEVAGIRVTPRGSLRLVTTRHTELDLPALRARDLPRLAEFSGGRITVP